MTTKCLRSKFVAAFQNVKNWWKVEKRRDKTPYVLACMHGEICSVDNQNRNLTGSKMQVCVVGNASQQPQCYPGTGNAHLATSANTPVPSNTDKAKDVDLNPC